MNKENRISIINKDEYTAEEMFTISAKYQFISKERKLRLLDFLTDWCNEEYKKLNK